MMNESTVLNEEQLSHGSLTGEVPFWDHPFVKGYMKRPTNYQFFTTVEQSLALYKRQRIDDKDIMLLKVLGDAICANEDQLRRYLSSQMSRSEVSKRLDKFRQLSLADRWHVRLKDDEHEDIKPPAPYTLGIAGNKLLKYFYPEEFYLDPNQWDKLGVYGIQRYVAVNELRCSLMESRVVKEWKFKAEIKGFSRAKRPFAVANVHSPKGLLTFIVERIHRGQDFLSYLKERLNEWKVLFEKTNQLRFYEMEEGVPIVVLNVSTYSLAEHLQYELMLDTFPFTIWLCVDEFMPEGIERSFVIPRSDGLHRTALNFLKRNDEERVNK